MEVASLVLAVLVSVACSAVSSGVEDAFVVVSLGVEEALPCPDW